MLIQDITPPEKKNTMTVNFELTLGEIQLIADSLTVASVFQLDPPRATRMLDMRDGFETAHEQLRKTAEEALKDGEP